MAERFREHKKLLKEVNKIVDDVTTVLLKHEKQIKKLEREQYRERDKHH